MNPLLSLIYGTVLLCVIVVVVALLCLHLLFKKYGWRMVDWYTEKLDIRWVRALSGVILTILFILLWYGIYKLLF